MDAYQIEVQLEEHNRVIDAADRLERKREREERVKAELAAFLESQTGQSRGSSQKALALSSTLRLFSHQQGIVTGTDELDELMTAGPTRPPSAGPSTPRSRTVSPTSDWSRP